MTISPLAGKPAPKDMLIDVARLEREYFERRPDLDDPEQLVSFGTSGHRGSPLRRHRSPKPTSWRSPRPSATTGAPRAPTARSIMGKDTHALSGPAQRTALEVLAANGVETIIQRDDGFTPTPVISRAILVYNRGRTEHLGRRHCHHAVAQPAGGRRLQVQPDQRRPGRHRRDPVDREPGQRTSAERQRRREASGFATAFNADTTHQEDFVLPYVNDLRNVVDMEAIRAAGLKLGVDPLGGAAVHYWEPINDRLRPGYRRRQPEGRSDLLVHDGRPRRQDPHGLLEPLRDGQPGRAQGPLSTSPSPTTPTPIGTASSRRRPG